MKHPEAFTNRRILIVDDNPSIHADFHKVLSGETAAGDSLARTSAALFGESPPATRQHFDIVSCHQGQEGLETVREATRAGKRFAMAFIDVRMPPGWDGVETIARIWEVDPDIQMVICTAFSDFTWDDITARLHAADRLVILKKPFDVLEVLQLASALTEKWSLLQQAKEQVHDLEAAVAQRTSALQNTNEQLRREIHERCLTEQTLRATQEKLNCFLARSPAVLFSLHVQNGQLTPAWISDNFAAFLGGEVRDWHAQTPALEYVDEADRDSVRTGIKTLLAEESVSLQYRVRRRDGDVRWVRDDRQLLRDADGHAVEVVGCWTDITEQRLLEEELRQSQKMESIGQLAGGVAHDFNNLLTIVRCHAELLLHTEMLSETAAESLRQIQSATARAGDLTRQLLAFSRKQMLRPREFDLNKLLGDALQLLGRTLGAPVTVEAHLASNLPGVFADASLIQQVIMSLAVNARDAMPQGGRLTLGTSVRDVGEEHRRRQPDSRAGRFVCLSVADTGCGIEDEHIPRLFEPFFTTKELGKGTGLGLATVYGIVRQHHGWIEVESRLGQGTTFRVFLPTGDLPASADESPAQQRTLFGGRETILVAEDDPALRGLFRTALQRQGYVVHTAASAVEALQLWAAHGEIDLLLTDIVMPGDMTGWDLAHELRTRKPALKVIYMSGYGVDVPEQHATLQKEIRFLQKPCGPHQITDAVRRCLDEQAHHAPLPGGPKPEPGAGRSSPPAGSTPSRDRMTG